MQANTNLQIGLASKIFGLGVKQAGFLCSKLGIYPNMRMHELTEPKVLAITKELSELKVGNDLKNEILGNIRLKRQIGSYAGRRHQAGYVRRFPTSCYGNSIEILHSKMSFLRAFNSSLSFY